MPLKLVNELYTAIGYNKHGKTELYRGLMRHLEEPDARFAFVEGDEGMVMAVFTLPSFNVVFKIIKDSFGAPKNTTRRAVMEKYHFVFVRDRVGRLADAQEFEHLEFPRRCFPEDYWVSPGRGGRDGPGRGRPGHRATSLYRAESDSAQPVPTRCRRGGRERRSSTTATPSRIWRRPTFLPGTCWPRISGSPGTAG